MLKSAFVRNSFIVLFSQGAVYIANIIMAGLLPGLLGVNGYGAWQTYMLYVGYVGFFQFGLNDGVYIRFGEYDYDRLPRPLLRTVFKVLLGSQVFFGLFSGIITAYVNDFETKTAITYTAFNLVLLGTNAFFVMIFQVTTQFKNYAIIQLIPKLILATFTVLFLLSNVHDFRVVILVDIVAKAVTLILSVWMGRDLVFGESQPVGTAFQSILDIVNSGLLTTIINVLNIIVLSFGSIILERRGPLDQFSLYAFGMTIVNSMLMLVTAIGSVIYPLFCRAKDDLKDYFEAASLIVVSITFCFLGFYPILRWFLHEYFSDFDDLASYLYILMPLVIAQAKTTIVIRNLFNASGWLKPLLAINLVSALLAILLSMSVYSYFATPNAIAWTTLVTLLIRGYVSEVYCRIKLDVKKWGDLFSELLVIAMFIISVGYNYLIAYYITLVLFLLFNMKRINHGSRLFLQAK